MCPTEGDIVTNLQLQIEERVKIADKATNEDASAGTSDDKWMTPARTKQMIEGNDEYTFEGGVKGKIVEAETGFYPVWSTVHNSFHSSNLVPGSDGYNPHTNIDFVDFILYINSSNKICFIRNDKIELTSIDAISIIRPTLESNKVYILSNPSTNVWRISEITPTMQNPVGSYINIHSFSCPDTASPYMLLPEFVNSPYIGICYMYDYVSHIKTFNRSNSAENEWTNGIELYAEFGYITGTNAVVFGSKNNYPYYLYTQTINLLNGSVTSIKELTSGGKGLYRYLERFDDGLRLILCAWSGSSSNNYYATVTLKDASGNFSTLGAQTVSQISLEDQRYYTLLKQSLRNKKIVSNGVISKYGVFIVTSNTVTYFQQVNVGDERWIGLFNNRIVGEYSYTYDGSVFSIDTTNGHIALFYEVPTKISVIASGEKYIALEHQGVQNTSYITAFGGRTIKLYASNVKAIYAKEIK